MKKLKIAFDFDGCLDRPFIQKFARTLVLEGHDVWLVTIRLDNTNRIQMARSVNPELTESDELVLTSLNLPVFNIAEDVGIPSDKIVFTNMAWKYEFFIENGGFHFHFDDWHEEHKLILKHTKVIPLSVYGQTSFINKFNRLRKKI